MSELFAYDDHAAMMSEIVTRPLGDWISEIIALRQVARAVLAGNDAAAEFSAGKWADKWSG